MVETWRHETDVEQIVQRQEQFRRTIIIIIFRQHYLYENSISRKKIHIYKFDAIQ